MAHVGVVFGGRSVEHQVSIRSARTVVQGLRDAGHPVTPLGIAQDGCWIDAEASEAVIRSEGTRAIPPVEVPIAPTLRHLLASGVEVLFPIVHGTWGEDGTLQGLCEMLDLAYVGPGVTASALAMDKVLCKRQLAAAGVPVVEYEAIRRRRLRGRARDASSRLRAAAVPRCSSSRASAAPASGVQKVADAAELRGGRPLRPAVRRRGAGGAGGQGAGAGVRGPRLPRDRGLGGGGDRPRQRFLRLRGQVPPGHGRPDRPGRDPRGHRRAAADAGGATPSRPSAAWASPGSTSCWRGTGRTASTSTRSTPSPASPASPCTPASGASPESPCPSWSTAWCRSPSSATTTGSGWTAESRISWASSAGRRDRRLSPRQPDPR